MTRRVVLIRAVNVGGAKLPMSDLKAIAADLGASDVATYIASGNLVADVPGDPDAFDRALESTIQERFGYFREAISRTRDEMVAALDAHPFEVLEPKYSYISFMLSAPTAEAVEAAAAVPTGDDRWQVVGRELHLRYAAGAGRAQLKDAQLLRALGKIPTTARNLNTVRTLIEMAS
ncbi:DUF1697 domain-containing protein [Nocardioides sp. CER19]|uniref:DUF1697 domain-containing protein n=1 Tax=Nocardioides sp. CER19 TaxID=3038538 RepID=UPI002448ADB2|nr:DUF1697 domain-containing protein [Nocardioides sp. CER19]MDH2415682.1 DUF1697 domain-containing protein [Nocardioides sp. CER19]